MPWQECHVMDERLRFVARLLEGEKMAPLCAEFGVSRKTGYPRWTAENLSLALFLVVAGAQPATGAEARQWIAVLAIMLGLAEAMVGQRALR